MAIPMLEPNKRPAIVTYKLIVRASLNGHKNIIEPAATCLPEKVKVKLQ